ALGNPFVPARGGGRSHLRDDSTGDRKPPCATTDLCRSGVCESNLRFASHGDERIDRACVYHLPHRAFYSARYRSPFLSSQGRSSRALRRLLNDGVRIPKLLRLRLLRTWPLLTRASSKPRIVELLSIARI